MDGRIFFIKKRILENLEHTWTVEEMADYVELSVSHFQKLFKSHLKVAPIEFIREARLEKARELLETTFSQVNQISKKIGLSDESHFTRDFKKKYGVTPTEYRKQFWKKTQDAKQNE